MNRASQTWSGGSGLCGGWRDAMLRHRELRCQRRLIRDGGSCVTEYKGLLREARRGEAVAEREVGKRSGATGLSAGVSTAGGWLPTCTVSSFTRS